jgi:hypothetical protein
MGCNLSSKPDVLNYVLDVGEGAIPSHCDFAALVFCISNVRRGMISAITRVLHSDISSKFNFQRGKNS